VIYLPANDAKRDRSCSVAEREFVKPGEMSMRGLLEGWLSLAHYIGYVLHLERRNFTPAEKAWLGSG
jgi:hypothetical protein